MKYLGLLLAVLFLSCCGKPPAGDAALQGRLEAAKAISDPNVRNESLGLVAVDAANAKDIPTTTQAIESISEPSRMNSTAATCALALAKKAEPKPAAAIAQMITDTSLRNSTLQTIAKGP
jgi:hypothetical protein